MKKIKRIGEAVIDALFPARCPVCGDIVTPGGRRVCRDCEGVLKYVEEPYCLKCGGPLKNTEEVLCGDCSLRERKFDRGRAVFVYNDIMSLSIYGFKYNKRQEYAAFYADEIVKRLGRFLRDLKPDALVPVPLSRQRYIKRGYNQAELISDELSKRTGVPVARDLLVRTKNTKPQKNLSGEERENNLKRAFKIGRNDVSLKTVVLIDDIYTTGSTIASAAGCLKENGVKGVYFVVLSTSSML